METPTRLLIVAGLLVALGVYGAVRKPYGTLLPMDVSDLSEVQPQLDRLGDEERELVLGYLKRSNGDVLPPSLADPDAPFTARTFGEAIALQRRFLREQGVREAEAAQRRAPRERVLEPLHDAVGVRLLKRELLTVAQALGQPEPLTTRPERVLVVTYRLVNGAGRDIAAVKGLVKVNDAQGAKRSECWLDETSTLDAFSGIEVRCGNAMRMADHGPDFSHPFYCGRRYARPDARCSLVPAQRSVGYAFAVTEVRGAHQDGVSTPSLRTGVRNPGQRTRIRRAAGAGARRGVGAGRSGLRRRRAAQRAALKHHREFQANVTA